MNEQGTQVAPLLFNQLNPGGGEVITHYDFFMEFTWKDEHWPDNRSSLHFLFDAEGGFKESLPYNRVNGPAYIVQIFSNNDNNLRGGAEDAYITTEMTGKYFFTNDYLWDKPDIKGYRLTLDLEPNLVQGSVGEFLLMWARFTTILHAPVIHKIIDIGLSASEDDTFSDSEGVFPDKGAIVRPDVLTFLTYDEFMKKLKAAWAN